MTALPLIGLDFDNTIVLYDAVFRSVGVECGLLPPGFRGGKAEVRAYVQALPGGGPKWTSLQGMVYGPGIMRAEPAPGLDGFLTACRKAGVRLAVVSHKTEFAAADPGGTNLREAARAWIAAHGLTDPARGGIDPDMVFFETTRAEKVARIAALGCTHFVDDLEEVFLEPGFPAGTARLLVRHGAERLPSGPFRAFRSWPEITHDLLGSLVA